MVPQHLRSPREANARLEVPSAIETFVESPAGSVLARKIDIARSKVVVGLLVVRLHPWRVRVVAQTKVQGQTVRHFPCILRIDTNNIARLLPSLSGTYAAANLKRQPENEVCPAIARVGHRRGC